MTHGDHSKEMSSWPMGAVDAELERLQAQYLPSLTKCDIEGLLHDPVLADTLIMSSFGAESAALLHYVTRIRSEVPVVFLDTGKHFPETIIYRDALAELLGLRLIVAYPNDTTLNEDDPYGRLHGFDPNACCMIRKTFPLQDILEGFTSWISGRKRFQGASRGALPVVERDGKRIKVNPFALWSRDEIQAYFRTHDLPRHPLEPAGYSSIGCAPCTRAVKAGEDPRAGRWPQMPDKTECGIHLGPDGRFVRASGARNVSEAS